MLAGRYRLQSELGRGGMGRVWRGHDEVLDRSVAVKEVTLDERPPSEREAMLGRTMTEARLAARLSHPHIATVYDVVEADGRPWIVLQLVPAPTLADVLADRGPLPPDAVAALGLQVLDALEAAHAAGIVHRDVKPANILLDAGRSHAVLTDFGLATTLEQPAGLTQAGTVVGTPAYIAPERARGGPPTPQTDLWALGVTLYTAVEGRSPFEQGSALATISAVLTADPAPFERAGPLAPVIFGLLRKDPARRTGISAVRRQLQRISLQRTPASSCDAAPRTAGFASPAPSPARALRRLSATGKPATRDRPFADTDRRPARHARAPRQARRVNARNVAAVAALTLGVLTAGFWQDAPLGPTTAERRPGDGVPAAPTTPAETSAREPSATAESWPATVRKAQPIHVPRSARVPDRADKRVPPSAGSVPHGQARKVTGHNPPGHSVVPSGRGKAKGRT
ncbi:MAG TPA: protein kinase [Nonomuraea sp.]|nr:protein kinase [Nonomuraea sp.]